MLDLARSFATRTELVYCATFLKFRQTKSQKDVNTREYILLRENKILQRNSLRIYLIIDRNT